MTSKKEGEKTYKTPVIFLRKSKVGKHLYAFNVSRGDNEVLGKNVESLIMNLSDMQAVIDGKMDWCKVSVIAKEEQENEK